MGKKTFTTLTAAIVAALPLVGAGLVATPAQAWQASGSNGQIAWSSGADGDLDIWVMDGDGANKHQVIDTDAGADEYQPEWSPSGLQIAYVHDDDGSGPAKPEIWVVNADGSGPHKVASYAGYTLWQPSWTPDGTKLIAHANPGSDAAQNILIKIDVASGNIGSVGSFGTTYGYPFVSGTGDRIVFQRNTGSTTTLQCATVDGVPGGSSSSILSPSSYWDPALSPDGNRWVYKLHDVYGTEHIQVGPACSNQGAVDLANSASFKAFPAFSPDGARIVYSEDVDSDATDDTEIVTMSSTDGSGRKVLTDNAVWDADPSWNKVMPAPTPTTCMGKVATKVGTPGNDVIVGTAGNDVIVAGSGDDLVKAGKGNDIVCAGDGNDVLKGSAGKDKLFGEGGDDKLKGGADRDRCDGGLGTDKASYCERRVNIP